MENSAHVARKLKQITELVKEVEALLAQKPKQRKKRQEFSVDPDLVAGMYPKDAPAVRWMTCAEICKEIGVKADHANCTSVGSTMTSLGFARRRSNGKTLINVPDLHETF